MKWPFLLFIALVLAVACGGSSNGPKGISISGAMVLHQAQAPKAAGDSCDGAGGFADVRAGAQVIVKDAGGKILGTSPLQPGSVTQEKDCRFPFKLAGLPATDFYSVEVGRRGAIVYSLDQLKANGFQVGMTLGQ